MRDATDMLAEWDDDRIVPLAETFGLLGGNERHLGLESHSGSDRRA